MYSSNNFDADVNAVLNSAIDYACSIESDSVKTEHLLLTILRSNHPAADLIKQFGVTEQYVLDKIEKTPKLNAISQDHIAISRNLNLVLERAMQRSFPIQVSLRRLVSTLITVECTATKIIQQFINENSAANQGDGMYADGTSGENGENDISKFGRDLTKLAREGKIDPCIGREKEIERVIEILLRRKKNNPCLIGEPGVGKTAIAEGLSLKIASGDVPEMLKDKKIISIDLNSMVAGTQYRGEFEKRMKSLIDSVEKDKNIILFIDEIHNIVGAGNAEGASDAANILKPALARGELQLIGATTTSEYRKYIEKDGALERRFQPVTVDEPTEEDTVQILQGLKDTYEKHHKIEITDEAIRAAVHLSRRYIQNRFLPDKAIDLVDEACSKVRMSVFTPDDSIKVKETEKADCERKKNDAVKCQDFEAAAKYRDRINELNGQIETEKKRMESQNDKKVGTVTADTISQIVSEQTNIPVTKLTQEEGEKLLNLENELHGRIIGQQRAVESVAKAIRRNRAGLKDPKRPIGSFLFLGPTGVGKTELCKALAQSMFGDENSIIRLDMSEYMEKHSVSKLIGSPPGYVGYDEGGQLTEKIRKKPYSVVLFDEIEKAHPDVFNMLLQVLDDGRLTDSTGRVVSFKNAIIIMTSNVGARAISEKQKSLGFVSDDTLDAQSQMEDVIKSELKDTFRPEFLNRIDDIIVFKSLTKDEIHSIASKLLNEVSDKLREMDFDVSFTEKTVDMVADKGFDEVYGARPLKRAIQQNVEDVLSEQILSGNLVTGKKYSCDFDETLKVTEI